MAPIAVARTYKGNERKKRRPWANIHNILSEFQTKEEKESIDAFDALFTQKIKIHKKERTVKHRNKENKECKSNKKELHYKRRIETKLETVNVTISLEDTVLDTTFDRILAGPVFQRPKPVDNSHKNKEFNSGVINSSENQSDLKCSASEPSCDDEYTFPSTWKTRKKPQALRRRKSLSKHFVAEANSPLQLFCNLKIHASKSKTLDMNSCFTSTPKRRNNCKKETQITPLLSPILHIIDKGQRGVASNEKEEKSSYQNAVSLSNLPVITCNTGKNISDIPYAPELHQFDSSCNTSNVLSAPLIDAEKVSSSLNKLSSHKVDSLISVNKVLTDSVDVTKNVPSQLQSLSHKTDERIVATIADTNILHDTHCEFIDLKECFTCKEDNMISGSEPCMSDSVTDVSTNGCVISTAVPQFENVNMRRQKKRHFKCEEKNLYNSDDNSGKDFLGFSTMSLCGVDSDSTKTSKILDSEFVECEVTKDYKDKKCISPSKSSNLSVILFDSWDSVANEKLEFTSERPSGSVENKEEIFQTSTEESDNCNSRDNPSQKSIMLSTDIGKSLHINNLRSHPAEKSERLTGDEEDSLCSDVSKCHLLQESSVYVNESHNDPRSHRTEEFEVHIMNELLHSEKHVLQESSVLSIGKGASHNNDPAQEVSVHAEICPDLEHVDENTGSCLGRYFAEKLASSANTEHNSNMTVNKQKKSLKRYSSRRFSHQVVPGHAFCEEQVKLPSFRDVYHKTTSKCKSEQTVTLEEEDKEEFKVLTILEESPLQVSYTFTARDVVLQRCCQLAPISFSEAFPASYWLTCKKIGEGLYGEVFLSEGDDSSVFKIIPIEGDALVNGEPQKKFQEILSEIVIAMELSNLRNGTENRTQSFSEVKRCLCVQGVYPRELINLWQDYDESKGSENDSPTMFKEDQLYIILQLANGGCDLEAYVFTTADQSHSVLIQTAYALAVAEETLEFEHRDLHWGNVLISQTTEKYIIFRLCGKEYSVPTKGVQVAIIDFTLSRMSYDGCSIYNDLSKDPALFTSEGDYQFEVYRLMQKCTLDNWHNFKPYTNLLWLHYLLDKMRTMVNYRRKSTKSHKQGMEMLEKLQDVVLIYTSAQDFVVNEEL